MREDILIQNELRMGRPLHELVARYGLAVRRHEANNNLVHFKYTIESPMREKIVQQCRGLILDEDKNWATVARPFDKFFNMGDPNAAKIDWPLASIYPKLDGSLMILYCYRKVWYVATSGTPDASGQVHGWDMTFKELFWNTFRELKYQVPQDEELTYMFELESPYNQVVVRQETRKLTLIGVRQKDGNYILTEKFPKFQHALRIAWEPLPKLAAFKDVSGMELEGYVIRDAEFNMVKLKHPDYVIAHQLKGSFSPRMVIEAVRGGDFGEIVATFPEWKEEFYLVKGLYDKLHNRIQGVWLATQQTPVKKDFAMKVKDLPFCGILFGLYDKRYETVGQGLRSMQIDYLQSLLERVAKESQV